MSSHTHTIDVGAPVRVAYDRWNHFEDFPLFLDGVVKIVQLDERRMRWSVEIDSQPRSFDATVTERQLDTRIAWTTDDEQDLGGAVSFETLATYLTRVTLRLDFHPDGLVESVEEKIGFVDLKVRHALASFKELIEDRNSQVGGWRANIDQTIDLTAAQDREEREVLEVARARAQDDLNAHLMRHGDPRLPAGPDYLLP